MHFRVEVVIPPTDDVEDSIKRAMWRFSEEPPDHKDKYGNPVDEFDVGYWCGESHGFWEWYSIGGRFSGSKATDVLDPERVEQFNATLQERKVTVSGLIWGKQELQPPEQAEWVDQLWKEMFPEFEGDHCPMFAHADVDGHNSTVMNGDVMPVSKLTDSVTAHRVLVFDGKRVQHMTVTEAWNGVNHDKSAWDGKVLTAISAANDRAEKMDHARVADDWLVVTVDCHS